MVPTSKAEIPHTANGKMDELLSFEKVREMFLETDKRFKETDKKFQETDKNFNELERLFTSQWGQLVDLLIEGVIVTIFTERGIEVTDIIKRRSGQRNGRKFEFTIIAITESEVVIGEVITTLRKDDIEEFTEKLGFAKKWMPEYHDKKIYGAVAFLTEDAGVRTLAERKGLFVIRATGDSASILNPDTFQPKEW